MSIDLTVPNPLSSGLQPVQDQNGNSSALQLTTNAVGVSGDLVVEGSVGIGTNTPPIAALTVQTGSQQPSTNGNASNGLLISAGPPSASLNLGIYDSNVAGTQCGWIQSAYSNNAGVVGILALNPLGGNVTIGVGMDGSINTPSALVIGSWSLQDDGQGNLNFSKGGNVVAQLRTPAA
jgi:hypothetical protein